MKAEFLACIGFLALTAGSVRANPEYESVLYLTPPLETTCLAVEIPTQSPVSGLKWFHNDTQVSFPKVVLLEGEPGVAPDLTNSALRLVQLTGPSLAWGEVDFGGPVTSSTGTAYAVFYFPEGVQNTGAGEGKGPGIGIRAGAGPPFYLTGDGENWVQFDESYEIGIEPIYASTKTAARVLADLQMERETAEPGEARIEFSTTLLEPRPNPFNPRVEIAFTLEQTESVHLAVFDVRGRKVATLAGDTLPTGRHVVIWEGRDTRGVDVASGVYFVRLQTSGLTINKRLALVR